ncbi:hypothetical protein [Kamptonema formosum]|uniref:hypothetical protein n=1 Tax=Kamptonema formosum TaxID=331992 RepID=UPI00034C2B7F|nr:hypothetical protein [Oscillatoria sp. PCC 10802]
MKCSPRLWDSHRRAGFIWPRGEFVPVPEAPVVGESGKAKTASRHLQCFNVRLYSNGLEKCRRSAKVRK